MLYKHIFLFFTFGLIMTCCTFEKKVPEPVVVPKVEQKKITFTKSHSQRPFSKFSTEVFFKKGRESVPLHAKNNIKKMFDRAKKMGKIHSAKIISWADQLRPKREQSRLSNQQLKLVEDRNDNLEAYLERLDLQMNVRKISMAERPDVMDHLLAKDDRLLKKQLDHSETEIPSKSIIMFVLKKTNK